MADLPQAANIATVSWTGAFPVSGLSSCVYGNGPNSYKFQVKCSEPKEADLKPRKVLQNWSIHQSDHDVESSSYPSLHEEGILVLLSFGLNYA